MSLGPSEDVIGIGDFVELGSGLVCEVVRFYSDSEESSESSDVLVVTAYDDAGGVRRELSVPASRIRRHPDAPERQQPGVADWQEVDESDALREVG